MIIQARTQSKGWKRGSDRKIAKEIGVSSPTGLHDMVGSLHLDADSRGDIGILTMLYKHIFGYVPDGGSVVVKDKNGEVFCTYTVDDERTEVTRLSSQSETGAAEGDTK